MGYETVNWNLGCPLSMIRKKGKGSGLLPFTEDILVFLEKVIPNIPNRLSIKTRLGSENAGDLSRLLPHLNNVDIEEIIIHPRTGKQLYSGKADTDLFGQMLSLTHHNIVYNGDIDSGEKFLRLSERFTGISRWMIGRGGIVNPFLPEEIKGIRKDSKKQKIERFISFHHALLKAYEKELSGPGHLTGKMKEIWKYWNPAFKEGTRLFIELSRAKTVKKYSFIIDRFFAKDPDVNW